MQTVIETSRCWMIRCPACNWHEIPKHGEPGASWEFDGNLENPTFSPSMNECINSQDSVHHNPEVPTTRCHFVVKNGEISFCGDCTHDYKGQVLKLEPWSNSQIAYHAAIKAVEE